MNNKKPLQVNLSDRSYNIHIGQNILRSWFENFIKKKTPSSICIVTDENVKIKQKRWIRAISTAAKNPLIYTLLPGEKSKTIESWRDILSFLLKNRLDRHAVLIALGGGVVGDITGFAASSYLRGIRYVQVPTTLLAMVDSSVGGKTAVNHPLGKNMIGAFWQPHEVCIDIAMLATLPQKEFFAGMAEAIKYAFIGGSPFYKWMEKNINAILLKHPETLMECIRRSCAFKADIVEKDERESSLRAILNYGHTFGHAIESVAGYGKLLHGEAINYGMRVAATLALTLGKVDDDFILRHQALCEKLNPPSLPHLSISKLMQAMLHDKKVQNQKIRLIMPKGLGDVEITDSVPIDKIREVWKMLLEKN
jgi:3-dehydroquinate synthase